MKVRLLPLGAPSIGASATFWRTCLSTALLALFAALPRFVRRSTAQFFGLRAYGFFLQTEDGSDEANRVIAEASAGDRSQPYPKLDYDSARLPQAVVEHKQLIVGFRRSLLGCGYISIAQPIPLAGSAHACGTLVTGADPKTSVVTKQPPAKSWWVGHKD